MGKRERPYVGKLTAELSERLEAASAARLFVVQEPGPTSFVLKAENSDRKHRVSVGSVHTCSCGARDQPCLHTAFVLLRIFRLSPTDPRAWQSSLIDSELEALVDSRARMAALRRVQVQGAAAAASAAVAQTGGKPGTVARRPISDDDDAEPCPICYEDLTPDDDAAGKLDWCSLGCGKSLHRNCFAMWAEHQKSIGKGVSCPTCRSDWVPGPLAPPVAPPKPPVGERGSHHQRQAPHERPAVHRNARCRSCRATPISGTRYRCLVCPDRLELCGDCFDSRMHAHHPFAARERPGAPWALCEPRPDGS
eukprot:2786342-Prymnesium_polylepis.1